MLDTLLQKDTELLIFLNNLGSEQWDGFWLAVTNQFHWAPLFALILFLIFKKFGWRNSLLMVLFLAILVAFSDQLTNFIKHTFERSRPCNTSDLVDKLRSFTYKPGGYSYYSGHAALSTTVTTFIILLLRKHYKYMYLMIAFPLLFGYSRIYLGVHYPLDVLSGYVAGIIWGYIFFRLQKVLRVTSRFS
ncbi:phosphatase PAP2 family protein [Pseudotenacibaculum sp. MALMAid0570]|uniref:phosphatase PAP2 family protein n=1 Tax=Pseudotenacibaculum sp. MALMAid0570 TaxID=3143938 RepID=UPI0032DFCECA